MTIDARVELYYLDQWNDISADVDMRSPIDVSYGQADEHSDSVATQLSLQLYNNDRKYGPEDPRSELFGQIGLSTPLRARIGDPQPYLSLPGLDDTYAFTPDAAALDIIGDLDARIEVTPDTWRPAVTMVLSGKYLFSGSDNRSYAFLLTDAGQPQLLWTTDGTFGDRQFRTATAAIPEDSGRLAVRWVLDVDDAGNHTVTFYTAASIDDDWTQLGDPVTTAGTTSIFAGTGDLEIGTVNDGGVPVTPGSQRFTGRVHAFELREGIDGTLVASPHFTAQDPDDLEFADSVGLTWTLQRARILDSSLLASVEITDWVPGWDETTQDAIMNITGAGILERLGQGEEPLRSSLFRDLSINDDVVAYYPLEDGKDASRFTSGRQNDITTLSIAGDVTLSAFDDFAASEPLPTVDAGYIRGAVPVYDGADNQRFMALVAVPDDGVDAEAVLLRTWVSGATIRRWDVVVSTTGNLKMQGFDDDGSQVFDSGFIAFDVNGKLLFASLWLEQDGSDTNWQVSTFEVGASSGSIMSGTESGTYGRFTIVQLGSLFGMAGTAYGHAAILNDDVHSIWDVVHNSLDAWSGETALERFIRLTDEEGIPLVVAGDPDDAAAVGPQEPAELLTLLGDAATADLAIFGEERSTRALRVRSRADLYNQEPALQLDMNDGHVINPFRPPLDNQRVRNDVTVERVDGSTYRAIKETGPLNVSSPVDDPQGVGRHKTSVRLNLAGDGQLKNQATWRLHLGTAGGHRIANLEIEMEHHPELQQAVLDLQQGDRIRLSNPPDGLPPDDIDLLALGWTHSITDQTWRATYNCVPGSPYRIGEVGNTDHRYDTASSALAQDVTDTDTELLVTTKAGPRWTEDAAQFPIPALLGGEAVSATDVEPASVDTFSRTVSGGWEAPDIGPVWVTAGGAPSDYAVGSGQGSMTLTDTGVERTALLGLEIPDIDMVATVSVSTVATGAWITAQIAARRVSAFTWLAAQVEFKDTGVIGIGVYEIVGGVATLIDGEEIGSYSADEQFGVRLRLIDNAVSAKLWRLASGEHTAKIAAGTMSELTAAGDIGFRSIRNAGNTNTDPVVRYDDVALLNPQRFTVTRSVNTVTRAWTAGTNVGLRNPVRAGL